MTPTHTPATPRANAPYVATAITVGATLGVIATYISLTLITTVFFDNPRIGHVAAILITLLCGVVWTIKGDAARSHRTPTRDGRNIASNHVKISDNNNDGDNDSDNGSTTPRSPVRPILSKNSLAMMFITLGLLIFSELLFTGFINQSNTTTLPQEAIEEASQSLELTLPDIGTVLFGAIVVCVLGPVAEEYFFRGGLYAHIRFITPMLGAVILSSVAFAISHGSIIQAITVIPAGILFALSYELTSNIVIPIVLHIVFNTAVSIIDLIDIMIPSEPIFNIIASGVSGMVCLVIASIAAFAGLVSLYAHTEQQKKMHVVDHGTTEHTDTTQQ